MNTLNLVHKYRQKALFLAYPHLTQYGDYLTKVFGSCKLLGQAERERPDRPGMND